MVASDSKIEEHSTGEDHVENFSFRFSIVHLLYLTTLLAAAIAMFESYAAIWLLSVAGFWVVVFVLRATVSSVMARIAIAFLLISVFVCLGLMPAIQTVREYSRRMACLNNVRQLCLAMQNYQSARLKLPPAFQVDNNGKPMHSWRVLLLPEVEQQAVFDQYDFAEPWDGPNNKKLVDQVGALDAYSCPRSVDNGFKTPYKLVTGSGTVFDGDKSTTMAQIQSTANTILIIEDVGNPVCWMEPQDLTVEEAVNLFDMEMTSIPHHVDETKFVRRIYYHRAVGMLDGSTRTVGFLEDPEQIIPYLMLNDPAKKDFGELEFIYPEPEVTVLYSGYFLLAFNIFLAVLPCFWKRLHPFQPK